MASVAKWADSPPAKVGRAVLRTYAAVLFSRSPLVGLLLLLATATAGRALAGGQLAVLAALGAAWLLDLDHDSIADGSYGASALLLGLGIGQTLGLSGRALAMLLLMAPLCVLVTAALRSWLGAAHLPVLSMPFLATYCLMLGLLPLSGLVAISPPSDTFLFVPAAAARFLRSIGALFFLPRADAGALILTALLLHSRIAALLAALAGGAVFVLGLLMPALAESELFSPVALNAVFTAVAIGGVWFVPSPSSLLLSLLAVLLSALVTLGINEPLFRLGIPLLIIPFNITVVAILLAARQRAWDRRPKSVDFSPGTPEENLAYFRTRLLRFRWLYPTRFRLPVRGVWFCTQGVDGALSHKGRHRHAFDFEVQGPDGRLHAGDGNTAMDFYCYRLPVLAAAAGVVVRVEDSVPDNESGTINLRENWGNYVIIRHGVGLFSMVAHLQRGSIKVVVGQPVRQGDFLGLCGSSGRSPRPHLHFQLQGGDMPTDSTLPCRFTDAVRVNGSESVVAALCPVEGDCVRNLEYDEERAGFFVFPYRASFRYVVTTSGSERRESEEIESELDPGGQLLLRSMERNASLFYSLLDGFFTTYDSPGGTTLGLQILRAALSRVPLDAGESIRWTDFLPARPFRSFVLRVLFDIISPILHGDGIEMSYSMRREGASLVVLGESRDRDRHGEPILRTRAELTRGSGPQRASITLRGRTFTMEREADTREAAA